jgi:hypothetical protein
MVHNVQIKNDVAYLSCYGGGIRIVDLRNPLQPREIGAWARGDGRQPGFVSVWGAYPFFDSGKVIGSDMENGLIVIKQN